MSTDPLADEFAKLERAVARRELAQRQAACPHVSTYDVTSFGGSRRSICVACSLVFDTDGKPLPPREP